MTYQKAKEEIIESSPQKTDAGKEELYLYSLRKMAEENVENNRTGLTNLHNINSFFYLCGEMIKQQPGVHIVIEGVETEEQKSFLLGYGCTDAQGFLFHRPMPVEAFDALLLQQECESDMAK